MKRQDPLCIRSRRVSIPILAAVAIFLIGFGVIIQDVAWASRGVVRVELKAGERSDAPVAGTVELYGVSHALVIGIDAYHAGWPRLSKAVRDADLVASALEKQGFSVTLEKNLDSGALEDAFKRFFTFKGQNPQARLFVWFAGHGHTLDGEGFLIPADAPLPDSDIAMFKYTALSMRSFGKFVRLARAKHALGVFDACFAGTIFTTQRSHPPPAITRNTTYPVRQYIASGDENQKVSDNGRFRKLFLRALRGEAPNADANRDGYLTGSELGMFLSDRVTNLTRSRQTPRYGKLLDEDWDRGDFVFITPVGWAKAPSAVPINDGAINDGAINDGTAPIGANAINDNPVTLPTKPRPARLIVRSNVSGDTVTIDGKSVGSTGPNAHRLAPGKYRLRVEKKGYQPFETHIRLAAGEQETVRAKLKSETPNYANWRILRRIQAHPGEFEGAICRDDCIRFTPDGRRLLSGSWDNTLKLWAVGNGREIRAFQGHSHDVNAVAIAPDGHRVLSGSWDKTLKLWDAASGREIRTFQGHSSYVDSVAFSPDGRWALSGSYDKTLKLWEVGNGREIRTFKGHSDSVYAVAFSPDGRRALSGSIDNTLKLWDMASGREIRTFKGHSDWVYSVAFAPDGRRAISGSDDETLKLWEVASGREIRTFKGHSANVRSVAFAPDGRSAISGSIDNTLKLWDMASGKEIRTFKGHSNDVRSVAFAPDGRRAASGDLGGVIIIWGEE